MEQITHCFNCSAKSLATFYEAQNVPVHSCLLMANRDEALKYPKGDVRLGYCHNCGFIENVLFDSGMHEYSSRYEETQGFSPRFQNFARSLAERLIEQYNLRGKTILEIGCGKGEFLVLLCELGSNKGIGIDPGYIPERTQSDAASRMTFIRDFYSEKYSHLTADFVVCRHTLEHIQPTSEFLRMVRRSIGDRQETLVCFELPDVSRVLKEQAFWDIYYEHCSYFTMGSLERLFRSCGFEVINSEKDFDDQYLLIEARPVNGSIGALPHSERDLEELTQDVKKFQEMVPEKLEEWREKLRDVKSQGQHVVLWGSGSKAVAYLTTMGVGEEIEYVVDINPYKHGKFLAGTGHEIVPPIFLKEYQPEVVIAMNAIYCDEIQRDLDQMQVKAELIAV